MLLLKGVGANVIARLEQIGFNKLSQLKNAKASDLTKQIADMLGSSCWHNSPMARNSIQSIIDLADKK